MTGKRYLLGWAALLGLVSAANAASYISNGDFENPAGVFTSWGKNGSTAVDSAQVITGSHSAQLSYANAGYLRPTITGSSELTSFVLEADFAATDPGTSSLSSTTRGNISFQLNLRNNTSGNTSGQINLVLAHNAGDTYGTFRADEQSAGTTWANLFANAVQFSDATTLHTYHLKVVGRYNDTVPNYDVYLTDLATNTTSSVLGITGFQTAAPAGTSTLQQISFEAGNLQNTAGVYEVIDNVSVSLVPEPASMGLLGLGGLSLLVRRRKV